MNFDWFPRLFVGKHVRILGITISLGVVVPLKFLFDSNRNAGSSASTSQTAAAGKMGPQILPKTHLAYHEPLFIVKKGLFSGKPVPAEFVTELPDQRVRVREVDSGKLVEVPREQLYLRYR
ncbi:MAG TPA: hypothetical protein PKA58_03130 [Polyangium sp.]|nr:hypothetical protein [Polyangium sp.]